MTRTIIHSSREAVRKPADGQATLKTYYIQKLIFIILVSPKPSEAWGYFSNIERNGKNKNFFQELKNLRIMTEQLQKKVNRAIKLIQAAGMAATAHGQPLEVCYSGGKDSDVILELAKMAGVYYRAIYKNTTIDPPGTIKHVRDMGVEVIRPNENFFQLMCRKGFPSRKVRFCCDVLKEYKILDYTLVGVRQDESRKRAELYKEPEVCRVYNSKDEVHQFVPIRDWTTDDVAEFIKERGITCAPVYYDEQGVFHPERRLGCMCCPLMSLKKRRLSFQQYPNMVKMYCRAGAEYRKSHPDSPNIQKFKDVYEWFTFTIFCKNMDDFRERFGQNLFDDGIDCKAFLEQYFKITF